MPLDASDKLLLEKLDTLFRGASEDEALAKSAHETCRLLLEAVPADSIYRSSILTRLEETAHMVRLARATAAARP